MARARERRLQEPNPSGSPTGDNPKEDDQSNGPSTVVRVYDRSRDGSSHPRKNSTNSDADNNAFPSLMRSSSRNVDQSSVSGVAIRTAIGPMFGPNRAGVPLRSGPEQESTSVTGASFARTRRYFSFQNPVFEEEFRVYFYARRLQPIGFAATATIISVGAAVMFSTSSMAPVTRAMNILSAVLWGVLTFVFWYIRMRSSTDGYFELPVWLESCLRVLWLRRDRQSENDDGTNDDDDGSKDFILSSASTLRQRIRLDAHLHEILRVILHFIAIVLGLGNVLADCSRPDVAESLLMCRGAIQGDAMILLPIIGSMVLSPVRVTVLIPAYVIGLCVYFFPQLVPGSVHGPPTSGQKFSDLVLISIETVVCVGMCMFREERMRENFELHVKRHLRSRVVEQIRQRTEKIISIQMPVELLRLRAVGKNQSSATSPESSATTPGMAGPRLYSNHNIVATPSGVHCILYDRFAVVVAVSTCGFDAWCSTRSPADIVDVLERVTQGLDNTTAAYCDASHLATKWKDRMHHTVRSSDTDRLGSPPLQLQRVHTFGDIFMVVVSPPTISSSRTTSNKVSSLLYKKREDSTVVSRESHLRFRIKCASLGAALFQSMSLLLPTALEDLYWSDQDTYQRSRLMPLCSIVEGSAGYSLHRTTHNIIGLGDAVEKSFGLHRDLNDSLYTSEQHKWRGIAVVVCWFRGSRNSNNRRVARELRWITNHSQTHRLAATEEEAVVSRLPLSPFYHTISAAAAAAAIDTVTIPVNDLSSSVNTLSPSKADPPTTVPMQQSLFLGTGGETNIPPGQHNPFVRTPPPPTTATQSIARRQRQRSSPLRGEGHFLPPVDDAVRSDEEWSQDQDEEEQEDITPKVIQLYMIESPPVTRRGSQATPSPQETSTPIKDSSSHESSFCSGVIKDDDDDDTSSIASSNNRSGRSDGWMKTSRGDSMMLRTREERLDEEDSDPTSPNADVRPRYQPTESVAAPSTNVNKTTPNEETTSDVSAQRVALESSFFGWMRFVDTQTEELYNHYVAAFGFNIVDTTLCIAGCNGSIWGLLFVCFIQGDIRDHDVNSIPSTQLSFFSCSIAVTVCSVMLVIWAYLALGGDGNVCGRRVGRSASLVAPPPQSRSSGVPKGALFVFHFACILCVQEMYMYVVLSSRNGTLIYNTQVLWILVMLNWSVHRPLHQSLVVMWLHDAVVAFFFFLRCFIWVEGEFNLLAAFMSIAYLLAIAVIRVLRERSRREMFATEMYLNYQQQEMEEDYKRLSSALETTVPAGIAGELVRTARRRGQKRAQASVITPFDGTVTRKVVPRHLCVRRAESKEQRHPVYSTSRNLATQETFFCLIELVVVDDDAVVGEGCDDKPKKGAETLLVSYDDSHSSGQNLQLPAASQARTTGNTEVSLIQLSMLDQVDQCIPERLKSHVAVVQSTHNTVMLVILPQQSKDEEDTDDRDEDSARDLVEAARAVFERLQRPTASCDDTTIMSKMRDNNIHTSNSCAKVSSSVVPRMILDVGPAMGAVIGHDAVNFTYCSGAMSNAQAVLRCLDPGSAAVSDRFYQIYRLSDENATRRLLDRFVESENAPNKDEFLATSKIKPPGFPPSLCCDIMRV